MEYSDLGHAFTENIKIMSIHLCKWSDSLVVTLTNNKSSIPGSKLGRNLFLYNYQISFFFKLILFVYFALSCDELYVFDLYLVAFVFNIP